MKSNSSNELLLARVGLWIGLLVVCFSFVNVLSVLSYFAWLALALLCFVLRKPTQLSSSKITLALTTQLSFYLIWFGVMHLVHQNVQPVLSWQHALFPWPIIALITAFFYRQAKKTGTVWIGQSIEKDNVTAIALLNNVTFISNYAYWGVALLFIILAAQSILSLTLTASSSLALSALMLLFLLSFFRAKSIAHMLQQLNPSIQFCLIIFGLPILLGGVLIVCTHITTQTLQFPHWYQTFAKQNLSLSITFAFATLSILIYSVWFAIHCKLGGRQCLWLLLIPLLLCLTSSTPFLQTYVNSNISLAVAVVALIGWLYQCWQNTNLLNWWRRACITWQMREQQNRISILRNVIVMFFFISVLFWPLPAVGWQFILNSVALSVWLISALLCFSAVR